MDTTVLSWIERGGLIGLLAFILIGGALSRPLWVFGWHFQEVTRQRDQWQELALRGTGLAERGVDVSRQTLDAGASRLSLLEVQVATLVAEANRKRRGG